MGKTVAADRCLDMRGRGCWGGSRLRLRLRGKGMLEVGGWRQLGEGSELEVLGSELGMRNDELGMGGWGQSSK